VAKGTKNKILKTIPKNKELITKNIKIVGNQKVILEAFGCQLFNIGLTKPNL
jgi:hypothetical protein